MVDIEIDWTDRRRVVELDHEWQKDGFAAAKQVHGGFLLKAYTEPMDLTPPIGPNATHGTLRIRDELVPILTARGIRFRRL